MPMKWYVYKQSELSGPMTTTEPPLAVCNSEDEAQRQLDRLVAERPDLLGKIAVGESDTRLMGGDR